MDNQVEKEVKEKAPVDPFTRLMFGEPPSEKKATVDDETINNSAETNDYSLLLEQVDSIMESVNRLKPLVKELSPLLDFIKQKVKD